MGINISLTRLISERLTLAKVVYIQFTFSVKCGEKVDSNRLIPTVDTIIQISFGAAWIEKVINSESPE